MSPWILCGISIDAERPASSIFGDRQRWTGLSVAQFGGKHPASEPWNGLGPGVMELVADYDGDTYRAVYTLQLKEAIYVLHVFQKKSNSGIKTPRPDVDLVGPRLNTARREHKERNDKQA
jgi:phage-related protein